MKGLKTHEFRKNELKDVQSWPAWPQLARDWTKIQTGWWRERDMYWYCSTLAQRFHFECFVEASWYSLGSMPLFFTILVHVFLCFPFDNTCRTHSVAMTWLHAACNGLVETCWNMISRWILDAALYDPPAMIAISINFLLISFAMWGSGHQYNLLWAAAKRYQLHEGQGTSMPGVYRGERNRSVTWSSDKAQQHKEWRKPIQRVFCNFM